MDHVLGLGVFVGTQPSQSQRCIGRISAVPEQDRDRRVPHAIPERPQPIASDDAVGVCESNQRCSGSPDPGVARCVGSWSGLFEKDQLTIPTSNGRGIIGRSVVDEDDLEGLFDVVLAQNGFDACGEVAFAIEERHHDRDARVIAVDAGESSHGRGQSQRTPVRNARLARGAGRTNSAATIGSPDHAAPASAPGPRSQRGGCGGRHLLSRLPVR